MPHANLGRRDDANWNYGGSSPEEDKIVSIILTELWRQHEAPVASTPYVGMMDENCAVLIDGYVNIREIARCILSRQP